MAARLFIVRDGISRFRTLPEIALRPDLAFALQVHRFNIEHGTRGEDGINKIRASTCVLDRIFVCGSIYRFNILLSRNQIVLFVERVLRRQCGDLRDLFLFSELEQLLYL